MPRPAPRHRRRHAPRTRRLVGGLATIALTLTVGFAVRPGEAAVTSPPSPGRFTGYAFDACTAPADAAMDAWLASPYRAVGIYFGGVNRGCAQPNLTATWVARHQSKGWKMIPIYVGLQAPCRVTSRPKIDPAQAAAQGTSQADDAATQAAATGLGRGSVLIFDMEAYPVPDAACTAAVQTFMSAWTVRLHQLGYFSGFYSSMSSGIADMVAIYNRDGYTRPDFIDFARWDNVEALADPAIPDTYWTPGRRMKQYRGDHLETWGGVTINVDSNYVDFLPAFTTPFADSSGDGWSDVVARDTSTGDLYMYPGDGTRLLPRVQIGHGWNNMSEIVRLGDFDRKGYEDIAARHSNGYLFNYPGRAGGGFQAGVVIGTGWQYMREITSMGDLNRDGYRDVVAVGSTGNLNFYLGRGFRLASGGVLSGGWTGFDNLTAADVDGDNVPDLLSREKATGNLYLSRGVPGGLQPRTLLATGFVRMRELTMVGDFDRDGFADLVAIDNSDAKLYRYPFLADGALGNRYTLSTGWAARSPVT